MMFSDIKIGFGHHLLGQVTRCCHLLGLQHLCFRISNIVASFFAIVPFLIKGQHMVAEIRKNMEFNRSKSKAVKGSDPSAAVF